MKKPDRCEKIYATSSRKTILKGKYHNDTEHQRNY